MFRSCLLSAIGAVLCFSSSSAFAHGVFKKVLLAKYQFEKVSCYTCHAKEAAVNAEAWNAAKNRKAFRNDFGKLFAQQLDGKKIDERAAESKKAKEDAEAATENGNVAMEKKLLAKAARIDQAIKADFLIALRAVEAQKAANGKTYGELLKDRKIEGVK